jgi:hypothetical protein
MFNTGKAIPVTDRGGPQGCETSRLPNFLESRLKDDGEVKQSYPCNRPWRPMRL